MTIGAALVKLMKYAKVFASEGVGKHMAKLVDPVMYKYIAEEFREAVSDLNQIQKSLHLGDECCHQVLQSDLFQLTIRDWHRCDIPIGRFDFRLSPGSIIDLHLTEMQLVECNQDMLDVALIHAQSARMHVEVESQGVLSQAEFWTDGEVTMDQMRHIIPEFRRYGVQWCHYLHLFPEQLCFGRTVETSQIHEYRTCCQETQDRSEDPLDEAWRSTFREVSKDQLAVS
jgi:hypothetical protein